MDWLWQEIGNILGVILGTAAVVAAGIVYRAWKNKDFRSEFQIVAEINHHVNELLVELRTKLDAGRAYIIMFHNGSHFFNGDSLWYYSCVHESCAQGVTREMSNIQSLPFQAISREFFKVWNVQEDEVKSSKIGELKVESGFWVFLDKSVTKTPKDRIFRSTRYVCVSTMTEGDWKSSLLNRGIYGMAFAALLKDDEPIGLLMADWLDDDYNNPEHHPDSDSLVAVSHYAAQMSYLMNQRK